MMTVNSKLMTADDLIRLPRGRDRHELVRGVLRTFPLAFMDEAIVTSEVNRSLGSFVRDRRLGTVAVGVGFLLETDPDTVRAPNVALLGNERLQATGIPEGYYPGPPDLAVEVIAPDELYLDVDDTVAEWLEHGTRLVFVVNPRRRTVAVHRADGSVRILGVDDTLTAEDVVPGWSLAVRDLFDQS
jgi:Uma2 family endonuclease